MQKQRYLLCVLPACREWRRGIGGSCCARVWCWRLLRKVLVESGLVRLEMFAQRYLVSPDSNGQILKTRVFVHTSNRLCGGCLIDPLRVCGDGRFCENSSVSWWCVGVRIAVWELNQVNVGHVRSESTDDFAVFVGETDGGEWEQVIPKGNQLFSWQFINDAFLRTCWWHLPIKIWPWEYPWIWDNTGLSWEIEDGALTKRKTPCLISLVQLTRLSRDCCMRNWRRRKATKQYMHAKGGQDYFTEGTTKLGVGEEKLHRACFWC